MTPRHFERNGETRTVAIEKGTPPIEYEVWVHGATEGQSYKFSFMGKDREHAERCFDRECRNLLNQGYIERHPKPT